jgi:hypothetical protein
MAVTSLRHVLKAVFGVGKDLKRLVGILKKFGAFLRQLDLPARPAEKLYAESAFKYLYMTADSGGG